MNNEKYKTILNNLLDIDPSDSSVFTRISKNINSSNQQFHDIYTLFGEENFQIILENEKFELNLIDQNLLNLLYQIQHSNNLEDLNFLIEQLYKINIILDENTRKGIQSFLELKNKYLELIQKNIQLSLFKWKKINDYAETILEETNIWPLHIGVLFVSLKKDDKVIYAPLLFKETRIVFSQGKPSLVSEGDIKINEKLIFLLNSYNFTINLDDNFENFYLNKLIFDLRQKWKNIYKIPNNIIGKFKQFYPNQITNESLQFHQGAVLGIFQPSGGYARNRMKEIINNKELENIIDIEINKNIYENTVKKSIFNPTLSLFKLTSSNLSQDKAIISALNQNTIIWGPPGTGKSQTIVNLLTNILVYNKSAIVGSQKKVALEVIRNRMQKLSMFCLFVLNSKQMNKHEFYNSIKQYLEKLEYHKQIKSFKRPQLATESELEFVKQSNNFLNIHQMKETLEAIYYLADNKNNFNGLKDILYVSSLPKNILMPEKIEGGLFIKKLLEKNNAKLFFTSKYREIKKLGQSILDNLGTFSGNLKELILKFKNLIPYENGQENANNNIFAIKNLTKLFDKIEISNETFSDEVIQNIVLDRISSNLEKLTDEDKKVYKEFAASVRIQNLSPHRFVKKYYKIIKKIFPIIIATPDSDLSCWTKEEFDYGILDESSQIFIENGLTFLYLSKIKILAGDQMQMKPSNWFGTRVTDDSIYGKVESMLDYSLALGVYKILLDKNYRSNYASLMTFSSLNFYNSKLDVVNSANNSNSSPIEVYQVEGFWDDNKNEIEGQKALEIVDNNLQNYSKIILLAFNSKQFHYLKDQIFLKYPKLEEAIRNSKLMVKNLENIQGDEADLVVATVAYDKNAKLTSTYIAKQGGKNALNVAITRAKEKLIVIKTIHSSEVSIFPNSSDDLIIFKKWLIFLESSPEKRLNLLNEAFIKTTTLEEKSNNFIWFENVITNRLKEIFNRPGFDIFKNYSVGSVTIDFIITFNHIPYKALVIDIFEYSNGFEDYAVLKDKVKFLKSKKYDVHVINPLNYIQYSKEFQLWLKDKDLVDFKEKTKEFDTSYYELNEINNFKIIQTSETELANKKTNNENN